METISDAIDLPVVHVYSRQQAIEDGLLVFLGFAYTDERGIPVCITQNLLDEYATHAACQHMLLQGFAMLRTPDPNDTDSMLLRVIEKDKAWVILNGEGITFLKPEDY